MSSHIALAAFLYLLSLTPWCYLNFQLRGRRSLFRVFAFWSLLRVACLVPLVWTDFAIYSQLAWPCRFLTWGLELWVLASLARADRFDLRADFILAGIFVYELFPAISETQTVMESGGWLRLVPVLSGLFALAIWIYGIQWEETKSRTVAFFDCGRPFKNRTSRSARGRARSA